MFTLKALTRPKGAFFGVLSLAAVTLGTEVASAGLSFIFPPSPFGYPAGKTYSQQAASFWQWALSQPTATNPLLDTTGANCGAGQSGQTWFLAGTLGGPPVTRSCTVPYGKTLVFPILNAAYFAFTTDPPDQKTETFLRSQVTYVEQATNLAAEVDGLPVINPSRYLEKSVIFGVTLPENNIYGLPAGFELNPSVDEGYYVAVQPLTLGSHKIHFHGELPGGFVTDVTYDLTVR